MPKINTRKKRKESSKEDVTNVLEELQDTEEGETFYEIFVREHATGKHEVLSQSKEEPQELSCREEDGSAYYLQKHEAGDVRMLVHYQSHFIAKEPFPEDIDTFRCN